MQGGESSRGPRSEFFSQGNALGVHVVVITQSIRGWQSQMRSLGTEGVAARVCSVGEI